MKRLSGFIAVTGLGLTVIPSVFVWLGGASWLLHVRLMFAGMVLWFAAAPFWMAGTDTDTADE